MPVSKLTITRQVLRLSALRNPPATAEGWTELEETLYRESVSDEHAIRIVSQWISSSQWCATPADIRCMAEEVPIRDFTGKPDRNCPSCSGTGWEHVWTLSTYETGDGYCHKTREIITAETAVLLGPKIKDKGQRIDSNVRRCQECRYGRDLSSAEAERRSQQVPPEQTEPKQGYAAAAGGLARVQRNFIDVGEDDE